MISWWSANDLRYLPVFYRPPFQTSSLVYSTPTPPDAHRVSVPHSHTMHTPLARARESPTSSGAGRASGLYWLVWSGWSCTLREVSRCCSLWRLRLHLQRENPTWNLSKNTSSQPNAVKAEPNNPTKINKAMYQANQIFTQRRSCTSHTQANIWPITLPGKTEWVRLWSLRTPIMHANLSLRTPIWVEKIWVYARQLWVYIIPKWRKLIMTSSTSQFEEKKITINIPQF